MDMSHFKNQLLRLSLGLLSFALTLPAAASEDSGWFDTGYTILETSATVLAQKSYSLNSTPIQFVQRHAISPLDQVGIIANQQTLFSTRLSQGVKLTFSLNTQTSGGKVELKLAL